MFLPVPKVSPSIKPSNRLFAGIFDQVAPEYEEICNAYSIERRQRFVQSHAQGKILEVGAASGVISEPLKGSHEITVCDISPEMCRLAGQKGLKTVCCDAEKLPFDDRDFDTVVAAEVLYYFDHPDRFIREAARVLKPGGKLLLTLPSGTGRMADRLRHGLRRLGFSGMYFDDGIRKFMPMRTVKRLLKEAGFGNIRGGKMILFPRRKFDGINRALEASFLKHFSLFITFVADKKICAASSA